MITLGQALGKTVIAEGIETPAQLAQLLALGCELGQGYLLARPLTPERASELMHGEAALEADPLLPLPPPPPPPPATPLPQPLLAVPPVVPLPLPPRAEAWASPPDWPLTVH